MKTLLLATLVIYFVTSKSIGLKVFGQIKSRRLSEIKCDEYFEKSKNTMMTNSLSLIPSSHIIQVNPCLFAQGIIVGGENAKAGEFPHMAGKLL